MFAMSVRANVIFDDQVWAELQQQPRGERSRVVNEAVAEWLQRRRVKAAAERIRAIRERSPRFPGRAEDWIREDRDGH